MMQKVETVGQDIKRTIISTLCMSKQTEESVSMLKRNRQDTKEVKKTQIHLLEMKNILEDINNRSDTEKESTGEA